MKTFKTQKRLAAEVLGVGRNKVWFDASRLSDIQEALTKADMIELIKDKAIQAKDNVIRKKKTKEEKKKRWRGTASVRKKVKSKTEYIRKIRKLRKYIKHLKTNKIVTREEYHNLRKLAKSGQFKSVRHLKEYVGSSGKESPEKQKTKKRAKK